MIHPEVQEGFIFRAGVNYNSFWQVTRRTPAMVWVRRLNRHVVTSDAYHTYGTELPEKDSFSSPEIRCRFLKADRPCIRPSYDYAFPWNGNAVDFCHTD